MYKPSILLIYLFCFLPFIITAQISISGTVKDNFNQPLEFVEVSVFSPDSLLIGSTFTIENGTFRISTSVSPTYLLVHQWGKLMHSRNLPIQTEISLGDINIENAIPLEGIQIKKERRLIEKKADRLIFHADQLISASGGDALDLISIAPRLKVTNERISMIGKGGVGLMVNGRLIQLSGEDLSNYLRSIRSDDIKSIEIISNPPSKYSAEGNSGLINIITKTKLTDAWDAAIGTTYKQATYTTGSTGASFNLKKDKLIVSSGITYSNGATAARETNRIEYPDIFWKESNRRKDFTNLASARIGADYTLSKKIAMGIAYNYTYSKPKNRDNINTLLYNAEATELDSTLVTLANSKNKRKINTFNYHFIFKIDTLGRKLSLDYDLLDYSADNDRSFATRSYDKFTAERPGELVAADNVGRQKVKNHSVNIDMEHPLNWVILNYGARLSFITSDNNFNYYNTSLGEPVFTPGQSNAFSYKENTQAGYFTAQKELGESWEAQAGLRLESTQTKGHSITLDQKNTNRYTKLFPTAYVSYSPSENHSMSLSYNRRISRPGYNLLNPFRWVASPYSYSEGNPFLQPALTNNLELEYMYKDNYITTLYVSHLKDGFEQLTIVDPQSNIQSTLPRNFLSNRVYGISEMITVNPVNWAKFIFTGNAYYSDTRSEIPVTLNYLKGWNADLTLNSDLTLNKSKTLFFNISFDYTAKGVDKLDYNSSSNQLNSTLKWLALNKKLVVTLYANDILSSNRPVYTTFSNGIRTSFRSYYVNRFFRLSAVYNLGKSFRKTNREAKNQQEQERLN